MTDIAIAIVLGGALGGGLWCLAAALPAWRARPLVARLAPYVRDVTHPAGRALEEAPSDPTAVLVGGVRAVWSDLQDRFARLVGSGDAVERRLAQASSRLDPAAFRGRQLSWAIAGATVGAGALVVLGAAGRFSGPAILFPVIGLVAGTFARDALLARQAAARVARIEEELPTVLEFLALCLSAGEGVLSSVRRVAAIGSGEFTRELRAVVVAVDTGSSLADALEQMAQRLRIPALTRAVDHVVAAIDRGSPLAQTLQAQAADAREEAKRRLIEQAGRKEILMMIPLIFGLLPLSVLFAIFPGIIMLRLGLG
ncbi:type II secretion system F family protein [Microbacterium sp. gxy059]|uniref:type II secretion system F family protein n=1 Tax=Microbacterium sp. gxy059 TaxID=2957199 RepID=UPI003D98EFE4